MAANLRQDCLFKDPGNFFHNYSEKQNRFIHVKIIFTACY